MFEEIELPVQDLDVYTPEPSQPVSRGMGRLITHDVLEEMHTFPSIERGSTSRFDANSLKALEGLGGMGLLKRAETTVMGGNFFVQWGEKTVRNLVFQHLKSLAGTVFLTGDAPMGVLGAAEANAEGVVDAVSGIRPKATPVEMAEQFAGDILRRKEERPEALKGSTFGETLRNFGIHMDEWVTNMEADLEETRPITNPIAGFLGDASSSILMMMGYGALARARMAKSVFVELAESTQKQALKVGTEMAKQRAGTAAARLAKETGASQSATVAGIFSGQESVETLIGTRKAGRSAAESYALGIAVGGTSFALEKIALTRIFQRTFVRGTDIAMRRIAEALGAEALTENLQTQIRLGAGLISGEFKGMTLGQYIGATLYASAVGAFAGGVMASAVAIPQRHRAIQALKDGAGMNRLQAVEFYRKTSQEVMQEIFKDASEDFGFTPEKNRQISMQIASQSDVDPLAEAEKKTYGVIETFISFMKGSRPTKAQFEQEMGVIRSMDAGEQLMNRLRAEAGADAREAMAEKGVSVPRGSVNRVKSDMASQPGAVIEMPAMPQVADPVLPADLGDSTKLLITGRIAQLNAEFSRAVKQFAEANRALEKAIEAGTATEAVQKKADRLSNAAIKAYVEAEALRMNWAEAKIKGKQILLREQDVTKAMTNLAYEAVRALREGKKVGRRARNSEIQFARSVLHQLTKRKGLGQAARDRIKQKYSRKKDTDAFLASIADIEADVRNALDDAFKAEVMDGIKRLIKIFDAKGPKHARRVKLSPDSQKLADVFVKEYKHGESNPGEIRAELDGSAEMIMRMLAAQVRDGRHAVSGQELSPQDLVNIFETLYDFTVNGKSAKIYDTLKEKMATDKAIAAVVEDVLAGKPLNPVEFSNASWQDRLLASLTFGMGAVGMYDSYLRLIVRNAPVPEGKTRTEILLDYFAAERKAEALNVFYRGRILDAYQKAFPEVKAEDIRIHQMEESSLEHDSAVHFTFIDDEGNEVPVHLSRAQARDAYMLRQRAIGEKKLRKAHKWNDDAFEALEESMRPEDRVLVDELFKIYGELYEEINPVFKKHRGYDLPQDSRYVQIYSSETDLEMQGFMFPLLNEVGMSQDGSITNQDFFKAAFDENGMMEFVPDVMKIEKYMRDAVHFAGMADTLLRMKTILSSNKVRQAINSRFGSQIRDGLLKWVKVAEANALDESGNRANGPANAMVANITQGLIASKPINTLKQMVSALAPLARVSPTKYAQYLSELPGAIRSGEIRKLLDHPYFIARPTQRKISRDIRFVYEKNEQGKKLSWAKSIQNTEISHMADRIERIMKNPKIHDFFFLPTILGDFGGALTAAWVTYRNNIDTKKMPESKAVFEAIRETDATQQSGSVFQMTPWMLSGNPLARLATVFTQAPIQYVNRVLQEAINLGTQRQNWDAFARAYVTYFLVLPIVFDYISRGFRFDEEDALRAASRVFYGPMDSITIIGPMFRWAVMSAMAQGMGAVTGTTPKVKSIGSESVGVISATYDGLRDAQGSLTKMLKEGVSLTEGLRLIESASRASTFLTGGFGGTAAQVARAGQGVNLTVQEGGLVSAWRRLLMITGASEYATRPAGGTGTPKKQKKSRIPEGVRGNF